MAWHGEDGQREARAYPGNIFLLSDAIRRMILTRVPARGGWAGRVMSFLGPIQAKILAARRASVYHPNYRHCMPCPDGAIHVGARRVETWAYTGNRSLGSAVAS